jgi:hypothetical protein
MEAKKKDEESTMMSRREGKKQVPYSSAYKHTTLSQMGGNTDSQVKAGKKGAPCGVNPSLRS